jgi:hypothetical protein
LQSKTCPLNKRGTTKEIAMWRVKVSLEFDDGHTKTVIARADKLILLYWALEMLPVRYRILSGEKIPLMKEVVL